MSTQNYSGPQSKTARRNYKKRQKKRQAKNNNSTVKQLQILNQRLSTLFSASKPYKYNRAIGYRGNYQSRRNTIAKQQNQKVQFSKQAIAFFDVVFNPIDTVETSIRPDAYAINSAYCYDSWNTVQPTITTSSSVSCSGVAFFLVPGWSNFSNEYAATIDPMPYQILVAAVDTDGVLQGASGTKFARLSSIRYSSYFGQNVGINVDTSLISNYRINGWGLRALSPINNITSIATASANYITCFHGGMMSLTDLYQMAGSGESFINFMADSRSYKIYDTTTGCTVRIDPFDQDVMNVSISIYDLSLGEGGFDWSAVEIPFIYCQLGAATTSGTSFVLPVNLYSYLHFEGKPNLQSVINKITNEVDDNLDAAIRMVDDHTMSDDIYVTEGHSFKSFKSFMNKAGRYGLQGLRTATKVIDTARPYLELAATMV